MANIIGSKMLTIHQGLRESKLPTFRVSEVQTQLAQAGDEFDEAKRI